MVIRQTKSKNEAGRDNKLAETLKSDIEVTAKMFHIFFRKTWEEEQGPNDWKERYLIKILGKAVSMRNTEASHYYEYQGKFSLVLLNQIKNSVDTKL